MIISIDLSYVCDTAYDPCIKIILCNNITIRISMPQYVYQMKRK